MNNSSGISASAPDTCFSFGDFEFDFSRFNAFLSSVIFPADLVEHLESLRLEYMELSLYAAQGFTSFEGMEGRDCAHDQVHSHLLYLGYLIDLLKDLAAAKPQNPKP